VGFGFLLLVAASSVFGLALRGRMGRQGGLRFLALGLAVLTLAFALLGLLFAGWSPITASTAGLVVVLLFTGAALALPFGLVVTLGRK